MVASRTKPRPESEPEPAIEQRAAVPLTVREMLADSRARHADRTVYQQKVARKWYRLSFEDVWRRANDFAAGLVALGLRKGDRVAICAENSLDWAVAYYGMSLAGGVGVPLYAELRAPELQQLVQRVGAQFFIASATVLERLGDQAPAVEHVIALGGSETRAGRPPRFLRRGRPGLVPFDQVPGLATPESRHTVERMHLEPDDLANIVFTSGTTGGMKGVMLTHRNLMSNVASISQALQIDERDRIVLVLPMHHAFPFIVFLADFAFGGEMTFENDLLRVRDRLAEAKPTLFLGVPQLFELMYRAIIGRMEAEGRRELFDRGLRVVRAAKKRTGVNLGRLVFRELHQRLGGNLRFMVTGGSALNPEVAQRYIELGLPLLQGWGLSEASPVVSCQRWNMRKFFFSNYYEEQIGSVGPPLPGVDVALIDVPEKETYVHIHGEGELVVRGPNVFAGYWQAPEETRAAKIGDWLRTGDLGRIDEEGNIWITGRSKYVIVLDSGEKVVPDELEERFGGSELIEDVCVVARKQRNKTQVGAIIYPNVDAVKARLAAGGQPLSEASVRQLIDSEIAAMAKELAAYKRVNEVMLSDTPLPKTALRDIARGQIKESYAFELKRWEQSAQEALSPAPAATTDDGDATPEAAVVGEPPSTDGHAPPPAPIE
jgi:long-chain acyl-CoA synthetase